MGMLVRLDLVLRSGVAVQLPKGMRMVVHFHFVFVPVQFFNRVPVLMERFLAWGMDMLVRVLVRVGVLVRVRMHDTIRVPVLVGVCMGMDVRVRVNVFDLFRHDFSPRSAYYLPPGCCNRAGGVPRLPCPSTAIRCSIPRGRSLPFARH